MKAAGFLLLFALSFLGASMAQSAQNSSLPEPTLDQRVGDLEAYVNNATRSTDGAAQSRVSGSGPGHNAWMMTSAALVLFMTLPGLALFYGGLVRQKNVLSILAQCLALAGIVTLLWWGFGYSLTFARGSGWLGGLDYVLLKNVLTQPNPDYSNWVSHSLFMVYQLMFAIITPALTIGAIAERMKFKAIMLFSIFWMILVYFPVAHWIWGVDGWMNGVSNPLASIHAIDFAGGIVVHMTSGWSALALCIVLGKRGGFGKERMMPHSLVLCVTGTGMLWAGWYGFNAGSAIAADGIAVNAFVSTTLSAAAGCFMWPALEYMLRGKPSVLGLCSGAVAGLATITPASGFVTPGSAVLIGLIAGASTYFACNHIKARFQYDDSLDTFGVHAVGGTIGTLLAGVYATAAVNPNLARGPLAALVGHTLWLEQIKAAGIVLVWSVSVTLVLSKVVSLMTNGLRVGEDREREGLDISEHGEEGYFMD